MIFQDVVKVVSSSFSNSIRFVKNRVWYISADPFFLFLSPSFSLLPLQLTFFSWLLNLKSYLLIV
jgi:hypothetical protein